MAGRRAVQPQVAAPTEDAAAKVAELERKLAEKDAENQALRSLRAAPVGRNTGMIDAGTMKVGAGDGDVEMAVSGEGTASLERPVIEVPDGPPPLEFLEELKFNEEFVEVEVYEGNEQYPEPCISTWNGGIHQLFIRGQRQIVRRKFVEVLARSKPSTYGNVEYVDAEGNRRVKWPRRTSLRYAFAVTRDDNPRGRDWLRKILAQP